MTKRILFGTLIFSVVGTAVMAIFRPEFVNALITEFAQIRAHDFSNYEVVYPKEQSRNRIVTVNNTRLVAIENLDMSFPFAGTVSEVFVTEGMIVKKGQRLVSLNTKELELERNRAIQSLARATANLSKVKNGTRKEDITIYESRVKLSASVADSAREDLQTTISNAYIAVDNALGVKFQSIVSSGNNSRPEFEVFVPNEGAKNNILFLREEIVSTMNLWKIYIDSPDINTDSFASASLALESVRKVQNLFDTTGSALNSFRSNSAAVISSRTVVDELRSETSVVIAKITNAKTALKSAEDAYMVTKNELALKSAGSEINDIRGAEALVEESRNALLITEDRISRAMLVAPMDNVVVKKIYFKKKEDVQGGQSVVLLSAQGFQFEADVPEEDIGQISQGNHASVVLRSFPKSKVEGEVLSINEQEVVKNEDTYFRVNIILTTTPEEGVVLRTGMTGEATIMTDKKEIMTVLPNYAVQKDGARYFIFVKKMNTVEEIQVTIGRTEENFIQVIGPISTTTTVLVRKRENKL